MIDPPTPLAEVVDPAVIVADGAVAKDPVGSVAMNPPVEVGSNVSELDPPIEVGVRNSAIWLADAEPPVDTFPPPAGVTQLFDPLDSPVENCPPVQSVG